MIDMVRSGDRLLAVIVSRNYQEHGIHFFTPDEFSQQLAFMRHPAGKVIEPHVHNPVSRNVQYTQEVLIVKSGKLRVDFYDQERKYLESRIPRGGDVILLASGGHGFETLEEVEMVDVKQGPICGRSRQDAIQRRTGRPSHRWGLIG